MSVRKRLLILYTKLQNCQNYSVLYIAFLHLVILYSNTSYRLTRGCRGVTQPQCIASHLGQETDPPQLIFT